MNLPNGSNAPTYSDDFAGQFAQQNNLMATAMGLSLDPANNEFGMSGDYGFGFDINNFSFDIGDFSALLGMAGGGPTQNEQNKNTGGFGP